MLPRTPSSLRALMVAAACLGATAFAAAPAAATVGQATVKAMPAKAKSAKAKRTAPKADLVARDLTLDLLGDGLSIEASIANTGNRRARKSEVSIILSSDALLDGDDEVLQGIPIPRVQAGVERRVLAEVAVPEELPEGDLYLLVCADGLENVKERSETNNCTAQLVASDADAATGTDEDEDEDEDAGSSDGGVVLDGVLGDQ